MTQLFKDLFHYNHECNSELITTLEEHSPADEPKIMELFSHKLNAHHIWNSRIFGINRRMEVWQKHDISDMSQINDENLLNSIQIIAEYDYDHDVEYLTTKGDPHHNSVRNILFHIINHTTYHRGQIAMLMRQHGMNPLATDFVHKFK